MTAYAYELATALQHQQASLGGSADGPYALPWYLVIGEPGSGRSTAIKALNLSWPYGDRPIAMSLPDPGCTYWMPEKALFIEPGSTLLGPGRSPHALTQLCHELKSKRPREPIDGMLLIISADRLADCGETAVEEYAKALRRYLVQVGQALGADVPVYVIVTAVDALWGFGDVFQWKAERRDEDPWGFSLQPGLAPSQTPDHVSLELEGLGARIESMCFAKLSSEEHYDERTRAFQHLAEVRDVMAKLQDAMRIITMSSAFERAPWVRALIMGSGVPGTGNRLRHGVEAFAKMGLKPPAQSGTPRPGGLPIHALVDYVLLPEKDLVPTRLRWRDDKLLIALWLFGLLALGTVVARFFAA